MAITVEVLTTSNVRGIKPNENTALESMRETFNMYTYKE